MASLSPRPEILDISPYVGGESSLAGHARVTKLSSNETPLGTSPRAIEAYRALAGDLYRYPDGSAAELRAALAARHGIDASRIVCGNGSDELLHLLAQAYSGPGDEVLYPRHGFLVYPIAARAAGAKPVTAPEVDLTTSVDKILEAVTPRTRIVFFANPNNPTGTYISAEETLRLRRGLPDNVMLVIDAAYAEYADRNDYSAGIDLVESHDNVVMTRTFSKIYGMAALRLGWAYCPRDVADVLNRIRGPFNASTAAMAAGKAAVEDAEFIALAQRHNSYWRPWLAGELAKLGIETIPSAANFVLARFKDVATAQAVDKHLRSRGLIVRAVGSYGLPECLRITIGRDDEMRAVVAAFAEFMEGK